MLGAVCDSTVVWRAGWISSLSSSVRINDCAPARQRQLLHLRPHQQRSSRRLPRFRGATCLRPVLRCDGCRQSGLLDGTVHLHAQLREWSFIRRCENVQAKQEDDRQEPAVDRNERLSEWINARWAYWRRHNEPRRHRHCLRCYWQCSAASVVLCKRHRWNRCSCKNPLTHTRDRIAAGK